MSPCYTILQSDVSRLAGYGSVTIGFARLMELSALMFKDRYYQKLFGLALLLVSIHTVMASAPDQGHIAANRSLPAYRHIVVVIEENRSFSNIVNNPSMVYFQTLTEQAALLTDYHAITHPSLPNYLALFSGTTMGVSDDGCNYRFATANLYTLLKAVKLRFITYSQGLPQTGYTGCSAGNYRKKHNPAAYWQDSNVPSSANRPFSAFPHNFTKLPAVAFVVPDQENDMHDGTLQMADNWLHKNIASYADWAKSHDSLLVITWDEDDGTENNRVMALLAGAHIKPGQYSQTLNHYNLLQTILAIYRIHAPVKGLKIKTISGIWK